MGKSAGGVGLKGSGIRVFGFGNGEWEMPIRHVGEDAEQAIVYQGNLE